MESTSVAEAKLEVRGNRRDVDGELDSFIERRGRARVLVEGEYDPTEEWKRLERGYANDRRETVRELWIRFHKQQSARIRATLQSIIDHHEEQAKRWEGR